MSLPGRTWGLVRSLVSDRADLAPMGRDPRRDLLAGLTVAIVALPLALGFGVSSGLGAEAGGASLGRLLYEQRAVTVVRPASHVLEYGRLIVRAPVPAAALAGRVAVTYHADHIDPTTGTGWAVTASGLAEVVTQEDEAAHYRRTLVGWSHGPHDALLRIHPQTVDGHRFAHATDPAQAPDARRPTSR